MRGVAYHIFGGFQGYELNYCLDQDKWFYEEWTVNEEFLANLNAQIG